MANMELDFDLIKLVLSDCCNLSCAVQSLRVPSLMDYHKDEFGFGSFKVMIWILNLWITACDIEATRTQEIKHNSSADTSANYLLNSNNFTEILTTISISYKLNLR